MSQLTIHQQYFKEQIGNLLDNWMACKSEEERTRFYGISKGEIYGEFIDSIEYEMFCDKCVANKLHYITSGKNDKTIVLNLFIRLRRNIREIMIEYKGFRSDARSLRREMRKLRDQHSIDYRLRIAALDDMATGFDMLSEDYDTELKHAAKMLMDIAAHLDTLTTVAERCDLLNINVADRYKLDDIDDTGIVHLIAVHGLEDSAYYRGDDWKNGAMATAINKVMIDFLCNTQEGKKVGDTLFEPGGLLEHIPMYKQQPNSKFRCMQPRLRLVCKQ